MEGSAMKLSKIDHYFAKSHLFMAKIKFIIIYTLLNSIRNIFIHLHALSFFIKRKKKTSTVSNLFIKSDILTREIFRLVLILFKFQHL